MRAVLADQRNGPEIDVEEREACLEQRPRDRVLVGRTGERAGERGDRGQLPVAAGSGVLSGSARVSAQGPRLDDDVKPASASRPGDHWAVMDDRRVPKPASRQGRS